MAPPSAAQVADATILVTDDDRMSRALLGRTLRDTGYRVDTAENGIECLERMAEKAYDLLILDYMMPELDGLETLTRISADPTLCRVPVIIVSGLDDRDQAARLVEAGAADYITKPAHAGLLRARVQRCIEARRLAKREHELYVQLEHNFDALKNLERLRDNLTHMVVHDLRTPLTSILSSLKTLDAFDDISPEQQKKLLSLAIRGGEALLAMISDLLDISKIDEGSQILDIETIDPKKVIKEAVEQIDGLARSARVEIELDIEDLTAITLDPQKIRRVLVNILSNAIRVSRAGKTISLHGKREKDGIAIEVEDHGPGIDEEHLERIFDKFYQAERREEGRKKVLPSTGLGLTFCKMVVEQHGGRIWAESEVGVGSRFFVELPEIPGQG